MSRTRTRRIEPSAIDRRTWMKMSAAGLAGASASGWIEGLSAHAADSPARRRACIVLWMNGGPSQLDTFDLKPGHRNGGPFRAIETSAPGVRICEHLPKLARQADHLAVIRSMSTKEGDHGRATFHLRTGYMPQGPIAFPTLGAAVAHARDDPARELPGFVSIAPFRTLNPAAFGPGFLGQKYAPLIVGDANYGGFNGADVDAILRVKDLRRPEGVARERADARLGLLGGLNSGFADSRQGDLPYSHVTAYQQAVTLMRSSAVKAFDLDEEPTHLRDAYGRNPFGQGCLLARRLVERGVPFVEVSLNSAGDNGQLGWDTHQDNFTAVAALSKVLDPGWATLLEDLNARGLLDETLVVWMGEFGRTPEINGQTGRDHFPNAWTTVLSGGGIQGGQVIGKTSHDGKEVVDRPVAVADLLATICLAVGLDPMAQNDSNLGRPIRLVDPTAKPISEALA